MCCQTLARLGRNYPDKVDGKLDYKKAVIYHDVKKLDLLKKIEDSVKLGHPFRAWS